ITGQLDVGAIAIVEICRHDIDMKDLSLALGVPQRRPVFDGIVSDSDDKIGCFEQQVSWLVGDLSNPAAEIVEKHGTYRARCLEGTDRREVVLANKGLKRGGVSRLAR